MNERNVRTKRKFILNSTYNVGPVNSGNNNSNDDNDDCGGG